MKKNLFGKFGSSVLAFVMVISVVPKFTGNDVKAKGFSKTKYNTMIGTSGMAKPVQPADDDSAWQGSYVYFGKYDNEPMLFRVLAPKTSAYGGSTMFLDSDKELMKESFNKSGASGLWKDSDIRATLNGTFLDSFTPIERASIAESYADEHELVVGDTPGKVAAWTKETFGNYVGLDGDRVFLLDAEEVSNIDYGYSVTNGNAKNRNKGGFISSWWLRSSLILTNLNNESFPGNVYYDHFDYTYSDGTCPVAPALNVKQSEILLSSTVNGNLGEVGTEYKLTLKDPGIKLSVNDEKIRFGDSNNLIVSYKIDGADKSAVNQVSVIFTDKKWNEADAKILAYQKMIFDGELALSGEGSVETPGVMGSWGEDFFVYVVAETVNGANETDYSSEPVELSKPNIKVDVRNPVVLSGAEMMAIILLEGSDMIDYKAVGGTDESYTYIDLNKDGSYDDLTIHGTLDNNGSQVYMLYKNDDCKLRGTCTFDFSPTAYGRVYGYASFILSDLEIKTDKVSNGKISVSSDSAIQGDKVIVKAVPDEGYAVDKITYTPEGGSPIDITAAGNFKMPNKDVVVSAVFKIVNYTVTANTDGNGTATASPAKGSIGSQVTLKATPKNGYKFKTWQVVSGGVSLANATSATTTFKIGSSNVVVKAVFEKIPAIPTPTAKPSAKPTAKPTATPTKSAKPTAATRVSLALDKKKVSIVCGNTDKIKATLKGTDSKISWKSSDKKIATVDKEGNITAKRAGQVTITATAAGKSSDCKVTVLYKDVTNPKDFWFTPINYLTAKGVVKGYSQQTKFKPANVCTRAQMVTFIWRLVGEPAPKAKTCKFKDVKKTDYYYQACIWGNEKHIVEGYKDGTFGPKIVCARRHAVTFLWRLAGCPAPKSSKNKFKDVKQKDYFYKATLWASEKKVLAGYSDGTFRPNGNCLRRQMVTFLYKYDKFINTNKK